MFRFFNHSDMNGTRHAFWKGFRDGSGILGSPNPMMLTEHTHIWLPDNEGLAFLSERDSTRTAIIYVHGFWGTAQSTWEDIAYYVDVLEKEPFRDSDLFFFDYPAEENIVIASVRRLRQFICKTYPIPPEELFKTHVWNGSVNDPMQLVIRDPQPYTNLILVGHSLGGVVIRRLVADALWDSENQLNGPVINADIRLFAPAHLGFRPAGKKKLLWNLLGIGACLHMIAYANTAFEDLKEGCDLLSQLQRETQQSAFRHPDLECLRPFILWGDHEGVVNPGRYDTDPPARVHTESARDHVNICKITDDYCRPAYFVSAEKSRGAF